MRKKSAEQNNAEPNNADKKSIPFLLSEAWLETLREGTVNYTNYVSHLYQEMDTGKISLEDLGTSEEEIRGLIKKGSLLYAKSLISRIKEGEEKKLILLLGEEAKKGYFSADDIGISEKELRDILERR